jgi:hypothetical protein
MTINELRAMLDQAEKELGGDAEVVLRDDGSDHLGVVRIECVRLATAVIYDLGNGGAAWTLNEDRPGTTVQCLLLD